jgi:hypothetical protein
MKRKEQQILKFSESSYKQASRGKKNTIIKTKSPVYNGKRVFQV